MKNKNYTVEFTPEEFKIVRWAMRQRADNLYKHQADKDMAEEIYYRLSTMAAKRINPEIF